VRVRYPTNKVYRPRPRRPRRQPWGPLLATIAFIWFVAGGLYFGYLFVSIVGSSLLQPSSLAAQGDPSPLVDRNDPAPLSANPSANLSPKETPIPAWKGKERINVLLLGLDQRPDEKDQPTRSDTMIVLTLDPATKTAGMLSIPRDLWVAIPGLEKWGITEDRINTAHFYGEKFNLPGGGPALAKRTVTLNFGIPIHYYARVDFQGFENIINTLGGVTVDVERPIVDNEYPDNNYGVMRVYIPAGLQHMDGKTALQYVRSRHSENDIGRARRQQRLLAAVREQALQLNLLPKLPALLRAFQDMVKTDLPAQDIVRLAQLAAQVDVRNIQSRVLDETMIVPYITPEGADVLLPKRVEIGKLIQEMFYATPVPVAPATPTRAGSDKAKISDEGAKIELLNGTATEGLATTTKSLLEDEGLTVVRVGNADRIDYKETVIVVYRDLRLTKEALAALFSVRPDNIRSGVNPRSDVDIRVIIGNNFRP